MDTKKESKQANVPAIAAIIAIIVSFLVGVYVAKNSHERANSDTCEISIDAKNVDGNITTKMRSEGNQDSCYTLLASLNAQLAGTPDDSSDDSAASDADAASAPSDASAPVGASE